MANSEYSDPLKTDYTAAMAIDSDIMTYWSSKRDSDSAEFTLDFDSEKVVQEVEIFWRHSAKRFSIGASLNSIEYTSIYNEVDGGHDHDKYSFEPAFAKSIRLSLNEPVDLWDNTPLFGIADIIVRGCDAPLKNGSYPVLPTKTLPTQEC